MGPVGKIVVLYRSKFNDDVGREFYPLRQLRWYLGLATPVGEGADANIRMLCLEQCSQLDQVIIDRSAGALLLILQCDTVRMFTESSR